MQKEQPLPFRAFMAECVQVADFVVCDSLDARGELLFEELTVSALTLLSRLAREAMYQPTTSSGAARSALTFSLSGGLRVDPAAAAEAQATFSRLFNSAFVLHLCSALLSSLFPYTPSELQRWASDAEQSILDAELDEEKARPAALRLFGLLAQQRMDDVGAFVLQTTQQLLTSSQAASLLQSNGPLSPSSSSPSPQSPQSPSRPTDPASLLRSLTSVYCGLGALCYDLPPRLGKSLPAFSFDSFFHQLVRPQLHALLQDSSGGASTSPTAAARCALICRVYWCVGEWCEALPVSSHAAVYESAGVGLAHSDVAVRFFALRCLERFVVAVVGLTEGGQAAAVYGQYVERVFRVCVQLIGQLEELELQAACMHLIRHSVAAIQQAVEPAVPFLLSALPFLWETAGQSNNPLRLSVLDTLTELLRALGSHGAAVQAFSVQVVAFSLDPKASDRSYLHPQALELWAAVMQTATAFTPQLLDLFPLLAPTFADESVELTESLPVALALVESYALLGGRSFMGRHSEAVAALLAGWVEKVGDKGLIPLSCTLETLAQLFPAEFYRVFSQALQWLLRTLREVRRLAEATEGGKAAPAEASLALPSDLVVGHLLYVLARVFFANPEGGWELLRAFAGPSPDAAPALLHSLLRLWLDKLDCVAEVYKRKLAVLAIGRLLSAQRQSEAVLPYVAEWLVAATGIQAELDGAEADDEKGKGDGDGVEERETRERRLSPHFDAGTEVERRRAVSAADPATSAVLLSEVLSVLSELQRSQPSAFHHLVEQRIPQPIQRTVEAFMRRQRGAEEAKRASPLSATLPSSSLASLAPPSTSTSGAALPTSHSHPSLNSLYQ